jgi:uncharacterized protein
MAASASNHYYGVELLLRYGASPNLQNAQGNTALMYACDGGYVEVVGLLMHYGASPDVQNGSGATALMWASYHAHTPVVQLLIDSGADPEAKILESPIFSDVLYRNIRGH